KSSVCVGLSCRSFSLIVPQFGIIGWRGGILPVCIIHLPWGSGETRQEAIPGRGAVASGTFRLETENIFPARRDRVRQFIPSKSRAGACGRQVLRLQAEPQDNGKHMGTGAQAYSLTVLILPFLGALAAPGLVSMFRHNAAW